MTAQRILVAIPHPDDEVVGCAVALRRAWAAGAAVYGLYLTTGVPPAEALWPWRRSTYETRIAARRAEARAVAAALGLEPLGFADRPSRRLKDHLAEACAELEVAIARTAPTELWVPAWEGGHQDHDAVNFLGARFAARVSVREFAEYNLAGGRTHVQRFPRADGSETVMTLDAKETAFKRGLIALYRSERRNLWAAGTAVESLRPLPRHDYRAPPHGGTLFRERFHWLPFRHPSVDFEPSVQVRAALAAFAK